MPRVISDELYDQLMGCVRQQRLLGVMGMLEKLKEESQEVKLQHGWSEYYGQAIWAANKIDEVVLEISNG